MLELEIFKEYSILKKSLLKNELNDKLSDNYSYKKFILLISLLLEKEPNFIYSSDDIPNNILINIAKKRFDINDTEFFTKINEIIKKINNLNSLKEFEKDICLESYIEDQIITRSGKLFYEYLNQFDDRYEYDIESTLDSDIEFADMLERKTIVIDDDTLINITKLFPYMLTYFNEFLQNENLYNILSNLNEGLKYIGENYKQIRNKSIGYKILIDKIDNIDKKMSEFNNAKELKLKK